MTAAKANVTNVQELQGVDVVSGKGVAIRFVGLDGHEHLLQVPANEAHGLSDMLAIALARLPTANRSAWTPR